MTHWSAWSWRFRPDELRVLSHDGPLAGASLADWPFPYDEIEPFYEKAEWDFGVSGSGYANPVRAPAEEGLPESAARRARVEPALQSAAPRSSATIRSAAGRDQLARRTASGRSACIGGACYGVRLSGAREGDVALVCIPKAQATGQARPARERDGARDHGRRTAARSVATSTTPGKEHEVEAKQIVVAGNAIGSRTSS
jgi:choline dehydrogenase-like flavoprotein